MQQMIRIAILWLLLGLSVLSMAQEKSKVILRNANSMKSSKNIAQGARRLLGDVMFEQDSTVMTCDSAYLYEDRNMFEAFGHVHLYKLNDNSVDVRSNFLRHDGDTKMAYFRHDVVLRDTQIVLYTDSLDYNIQRDIGYYEYGGRIVDSASTLTSVKGHYYHHESAVYFKKKVELNHNEGEYQMFTDTLKYNTETKVSYFFGPTEFYNDTNYMYAQFGWYDTERDIAFMRDEALYANPDQTVEADSLYYNRNLSSGKAYSNVVLTDTIQQLIVKGNYLETHQDDEWFFVTDSAQLITIMDDDTLFMHADTLYSAVDTADFRFFTGYHHVKIFKSNFQAKTDSLFFSLSDSIVQFHGEPILWAEGSQITADYIEAFVINEKLDHFKLYKSGLIISDYDGAHYNQIKGREITGYLRQNEIYRVDVHKNSETIYFPEDKDGIIGVNKGFSENVSIYMTDGKPQRIIYRDRPTSNIYPLNDLTDNEMKVKNFVWLDHWRPLRPSDIFLWESNTTAYPQKKEPGTIDRIEETVD